MMAQRLHRMSHGDEPMSENARQTPLDP